jgi:hypothetical protein
MTEFKISNFNDSDPERESFTLKTFLDHFVVGETFVFDGNEGAKLLTTTSKAYLEDHFNMHLTSVTINQKTSYVYDAAFDVADMQGANIPNKVIACVITVRIATFVHLSKKKILAFNKKEIIVADAAVQVTNPILAVINIMKDKFYQALFTVGHQIFYKAVVRKLKDGHSYKKGEKENASVLKSLGIYTGIMKELSDNDDHLGVVLAKSVHPFSGKLKNDILSGIVPLDKDSINDAVLTRANGMVPGTKVLALLKSLLITADFVMATNLYKTYSVGLDLVIKMIDTKEMRRKLLTGVMKISTITKILKPLRMLTAFAYGLTTEIIKKTDMGKSMILTKLKNDFSGAYGAGVNTYEKIDEIISKDPKAYVTNVMKLKIDIPAIVKVLKDL